MKNKSIWLSHSCKQDCYVNQDFTKCANVFTPFNQTVNSAKDIDILAQTYEPSIIMEQIEHQRRCPPGYVFVGARGPRHTWCHKEGDV